MTEENKDKRSNLEEYIEKLPGMEITRRQLFKSGALLGGSALFLSQLDGACKLISIAGAAELPAGHYPLAKATSVIYSVCLHCHTDCPIKVKILNGVAVKIDGNPYSENMEPHLDYSTSLHRSAKIDAKVCPKGQAGVQSLYDPYRVIKVLKRNGPRGSNKWRVISFNKAIDEVVNGGRLFASIGEHRHVEGLKDIYALREPKLSADMAKDSWAVAEGKMKVADFKSKYAAHLDVLIDPDHPDLGPKNNQFLALWGRIENGRIDFGQRFTYGGFGSRNLIQHTAICEQSHHIAYAQATSQYKDGKWGGGVGHMKPDTYNSEFVVYFGTGFAEANFGPPVMTEKNTERLASGKMKIAVVDPRMSKTASKAWKWVPINPSTDAAFALGMIRWIMDNKRYNEKYLANANKAAAKSSGETTWSNATHLVKFEKDGPGALLRASDIGMDDKDSFVVMKDGSPVPFKADDDKNPATGDLDYSGEVKGIKVKTAFAILKDEAFSKSLADWAEICGIPQKDIEDIANEFTSHGTKAAAELYRGVVKHTNGYYNAFAVISLNTLIGNVDHKGGLSKGGGQWSEMGGKYREKFDVKRQPGKLTPFGHKVTREGSHYEKSTLFNGYPAKRTWFPYTGDVIQEAIPSAADGYPYPIKAIWTNMASVGFSPPAAHKSLEIMADVDKIPLFISTDIVLGESTMYADYVFPDTTVWERFATPHASPDIPFLSCRYRQPTITPLTEVVTVYGEKTHSSFEAVALAIAERLDLPGFGKNAYGPGLGLTRWEDWYLKLAANWAVGDKEGDSVPEASFEEMKIFKEARRHLKPSVFSMARWEKAAGTDKWKRVITLLNRGGRWPEWDPEIINGKGMLLHKFGKQMDLYSEAVAMGRHSYTGERFSGAPVFEPVKDASGNLAIDEDMPLHLITYKDVTGGQSRTLPTDYWLSSVILPENYFLINASTANKLGFSDGDNARMLSATNHDGKWHLPNRGTKDMVGKIKAVEGMAPGVVAVSWHFGHWGYGASDAEIDGKTVMGDKRRATGLCPNAAMKVDPVVKNVCMSDPIGGSASFYDTRVKLVKA